MNVKIGAIYRKITGKEQLLEIFPGTILIKFPALGMQEDQIDLSDDTRYLAYEVYKKNDREIQLQIPASKIAPTLQNNSIPHMNGRSDEPSVLVKEFDKLVGENLWWIKHQG